MVRLLSQLPVRINVISLGERIFYLGTKTSKAAGSVVVKVGSRN